MILRNDNRLLTSSSDESGELAIAIGDSVKVALDAVEDGFGATRLSREKAKRAEAWIDLEKAHEEIAVVMGIINGKVKGGFTVDLAGIRAFLPGSLVDVRPVRDVAHLEANHLPLDTEYASYFSIYPYLYQHPVRQYIYLRVSWCPVRSQ